MMKSSVSYEHEAHKMMISCSLRYEVFLSYEIQSRALFNTFHWLNIGGGGGGCGGGGGGVPPGCTHSPRSKSPSANPLKLSL